jgi:hypothetical protein
MTPTHAMSILALTALVGAAGCGDASSARETDRSLVTSASATTTKEPNAANASASAESSSATTDRAPRDAAGIIDSSFDQLKFPMEKTDAFAESMLTDKVKSLFGERIRLRGFMFPTLRTRGLKEFVLVRDNLECCFGPGAALFDCVLVTMKEGVTTKYETRQIAVEGEFYYEPLPGPEGRPVALFRMTAETVK